MINAIEYLIMHTSSSNITMLMIQGLYSPSGKTSYHKISWSLEAVRFGFIRFQSRRNLTGNSAASLLRYLSNFSATRSLSHLIPRLQYFTRSCCKMSPAPSPQSLSPTTGAAVAVAAGTAVACWNDHQDDNIALTSTRLRNANIATNMYSKYETPCHIRQIAQRMSK